MECKKTRFLVMLLTIIKNSEAGAPELKQVQPSYTPGTFSTHRNSEAVTQDPYQTRGSIDEVTEIPHQIQGQDETPYFWDGYSQNSIVVSNSFLNGPVMIHQNEPDSYPQKQRLPGRRDRKPSKNTVILVGAPEMKQVQPSSTPGTFSTYINTEAVTQDPYQTRGSLDEVTEIPHQIQGQDETPYFRDGYSQNSIVVSNSFLNGPVMIHQNEPDSYPQNQRLPGRRDRKPSKNTVMLVGSTPQFVSISSRGESRNSILVSPELVYVDPSSGSYVNYPASGSTSYYTPGSKVPSDMSIYEKREKAYKY